MTGSLISSSTTSVGAAVLAVAVVFVLLAYSSASVQAVDGYTLDARFNRVDGLTIGTVLGAAGAVTMIASRRLKRWLLPLLVISQALPVFALAPAPEM